MLAEQGGLDGFYAAVVAKNLTNISIKPVASLRGHRRSLRMSATWRYDMNFVPQK